jgi:hypothetical protein
MVPMSIDQIFAKNVFRSFPTSLKDVVDSALPAWHSGSMRKADQTGGRRQKVTLFGRSIGFECGNVRYLLRWGASCDLMRKATF